MNAAEARKKTKAWHAKAQRDHDKEYAATKTREAKHAAAVWRERGPSLVVKIEGLIEKYAVKGYNGTMEPSDLNPNGDEIIWMDKADQPIFELIMERFRSEGFKVEEYQNYGMKITW